MEAFIKKVQQIIFLIREYGADKYFKKYPSLTKVEDFKELLGLANEGMKKGQLIILSELRDNLKKQDLATKQIKQQRQVNSRDKDSIGVIQKEIDELRFTESIFRNLMKSIVWQMFGARREFIARFHLDERGSKLLGGSGFNAVVDEAEKINLDPLKFALITDLTPHIQVGDLLILTLEGLSIVEVKTGDKNKEAIDLLNFYETNNLNPSEEIIQMEDGHFKDQLRRIVKQKNTNKKTAHIINNDSGVYQKDDNMNVHLFESVNEESTYHNELLILIEQSKEKNWAYSSVDGIMNIGVYRNEWRQYGKFVLEGLNNYPVYNLRDALFMDICEPIFIKPFPTEILTDIAFGKLSIFIGIDYDRLIEFSNDIGLPLRWSTAKELSKIKQKLSINTHELFEYKNKGLIIDYGDEPILIGMGFIGRLLFDHKTPQVQLINRLESIKQLRNNKQF